MQYQPGILKQKGAGAFADVIGASLGDALAVARTLILPIVILGALYVFGLLFFGMGATAGTASHGGTQHSGTMSYSFSTQTGVPVEIVVLWFFALAAAIRTIQPDFRMTAGICLRYMGWWIVTGLFICTGFVAFVVPGFWLLGRLGYAPEVALLRPAANPLGTSWRASLHWFWPSLASIIVAAVATSMIDWPANALHAFAQGWQPAAVVAGPIAFVIFTYTTLVAALTSVRWANELLLARDCAPTTLTPEGAAGIVP